MCKRTGLGVTGKEEEGRTTSLGPDGGFYNLRRGFIPPADAPILTWEARVMARVQRPRMSHWAIRDTLIRTPPLYSQSPSSICTSVSVSARPFASWTPLTPPRVEKRLNLSGLRGLPTSTRVSAVPWRLGVKPVSIYASPLGLTFGAKASTGSFQEFRNWVGMKERVGWWTLGAELYKARRSGPSYFPKDFSSLSTSLNSHLLTTISDELIFD